MVSKADKNVARLRRHKRVRGKISGTPERPRLDVFRSNMHIYAQIIDDVLHCAQHPRLRRRLPATAETKKQHTQ